MTGGKNYIKYYTTVISLDTARRNGPELIETLPLSESFFFFYQPESSPSSSSLRSDRSSSSSSSSSEPRLPFLPTGKEGGRGTSDKLERLPAWLAADARQIPASVAPVTWTVETPMWARHRRRQVYFLLRRRRESITGAAATAQTPVTVYCRQFQTSNAHGLNIASGDNRQVPQPR